MTSRCWTSAPTDISPDDGSVRRTLGGHLGHLPQLRHAAADVPVSPPLEDAYRPGAAEIAAAVRAVVEWDQRVEVP